MGYSFVAEITGLSSFVYETCREIPIEFDLRSRSSKAIDLGVNRKLTCDFLYVTNSNFGRICYRFRDIDA